MSVQTKPEWLRVRPPGGESYALIKGRVRSLGLATVCQEAHCPNLAECWGQGTATFMLMGSVCTRGCRFCHVQTGRPSALDQDEPNKIAATVAELGLDYVVLTSVDRDDLADGGAGHIAEVVRRLKADNGSLRIEVLIPDFRGDRQALATVCAAGAEVVGHNLETVERLTPAVRDRRATYIQSLEVLRGARELGARLTKSSLMLGLGETQLEVTQALGDLRSAGCDIVTLGQYLQPSRKHLPVVEYVSPERFQEYRRIALALEFKHVAAGPLVRSSYRAGTAFSKIEGSPGNQLCIASPRK